MKDRPREVKELLKLDAIKINSEIHVKEVVDEIVSRIKAERKKQ